MTQGNFVYAFHHYLIAQQRHSLYYECRHVRCGGGSRSEEDATAGVQEAPKSSFTIDRRRTVGRFVIFLCVSVCVCACVWRRERVCLPLSVCVCVQRAADTTRKQPFNSTWVSERSGQQ